MSTPKGFPSQQKLDRLKAEHCTIESVREQQQALSVIAHAHVFEVGTAILGTCTKSALVTTLAHGARKGDVISFTSGALSPMQVKVQSVESATALTLAEDLPSVPAAAVTISVLRHVYPLLNSDGSQSISATFTEEATAADGDPLPAKVKVIGGYDGADVQAIKTDASGELQIDVLSSALPSGAATETTLGSVLTALGPLATEATLANVEAALGPLGTEATLLNIESALGPLATETTLGSVLTALGPLATEATALNIESALAPLATEVTLGSVLTALGPLATETTLSTLATESTLSNVQTALGSLATEVTLGSVLTAVGLLATEATQLDVLGMVSPKTTVDLMDTPVLDASATSIPDSASLPLQVVASLALQCSKIRVNDTTGEFIGVYIGAAASEVLAAVIGPGMDGETDLTLPVNTRVSIKSMDVTAISLGKLCIQFLG